LTSCQTRESFWPYLAPVKMPWWCLEWFKSCHVDTRLHGLAPSYLADELPHPAESEFQRRLRSASPHELSVPRTRLSTELFQSPLYGSGTVFRSISLLLRHFRSSALAWRHTSSNSVTHNCSCHAREVTLSFMDTLIAFTYLLTHK